MKQLEVVRVRLKQNQGFYSDTRIATPMDVAFLFEEKMKGFKPGTMGLLNVSTDGKIINAYFGPKENFLNMRELISASILSNAGGVILVSNEFSDNMQKLTNEYKYGLGLVNIVLTDNIYISSDGGIKSYKANDLIKSPKGTNIQTTVQKLDIENSDNADLIRIELSIDKLLKNEKATLTEKKAVNMIADEISLSDREMVYVLCLDKNGAPINCSLVSQGSLNQAITSSRELFKIPLLAKAESIILLHNHPSGNVVPSQADIEYTQEMEVAGEMLGIELKDHIVVGGLNRELYSIKNGPSLDKNRKRKNKRR